MKKIKYIGDIEKLVSEMGFLPFFSSDIPHFSIEEFTPRDLWFSDVDGPWEWKGPILRNGNCAYGKLFQKKAGYVSMQWFPELVNYRRSIYDLKAEPSDSMDKVIYNAIYEHESLLSKEIKSLCGYRKKTVKKSFDPLQSWESSEVKALYKDIEKNKAKNKEKDSTPRKDGYETVITRLQMGTWVVVADFEYLYNKKGEPYGWGVARYTTPEALFGEDAIQEANHHSPEESKQRLVKYLNELLPQATPGQILKIIG